MTIRQTDKNEPITRASVWDPFLRAFHWLLVGLVSWSAISGFLLPPTWLRSHLVTGTAAIALVGVRVCWGFLGSTYARFRSFVAGRRTILQHVALLRSGHRTKHLGHNPLGGLMVLVLMVTIALLAATGVTALGGDLKTGPMAFVTSFSAGEAALAFHQLLAYVLLGLVLLHLIGVAVESRRSRENLIRAMIFGDKHHHPGDHVEPPQSARLVATFLLSVIGLGLFAVTVAALSIAPGWGTPVQPLDVLYAEECGACHAPFHPSLAPAATWAAIMSRLDDHFGENASFDPASGNDIRDYLLSHSAEIYDTKPAHVFRLVDPAGSLKITATPFWQNAHAGISDDVFETKAVGSRTACGACHPDAEVGMFYPAFIRLPEVSAQ